MPVFHAYVPAGRLTGDEKRSLADALNLALHEALGTPMADRFIVISEHSEDELFIHPTFPDLQRSARAVVITVTLGAGRTVEKKRKLAELVTLYATEKAGLGPDDVCLMMYDVPLESMSFGGGRLLSDLEVPMPWVKQPGATAGR